MEIHEYQAKALLKDYGIKTLKSYVADSAEQAFKIAKESEEPGWVVKAQVHAGGRGLGGGVKKASTPEEVREFTKQMIGQKLITAQTGKEGKTIHQVLVEQACQIKREFYCAMVLDRSVQTVCLIVSSEGGVSIE